MIEQNAVDLLLSQHRVPGMNANLAARIVAEAQRPGRARLPVPRRRRRRWTRRGVWTTVVALNLVLASAVAAAIGGGGGLMPASIVAATHRLVEHIRPHLPVFHAKRSPRLAMPPPRQAGAANTTPPRRFQLPARPPRIFIGPMQYREGKTRPPIARTFVTGARTPVTRVHAHLGKHPKRVRHGRGLRATPWRSRPQAILHLRREADALSRPRDFSPQRWQMRGWRKPQHPDWNRPGRGWRRDGIQTPPRGPGGRRR